jgi:hypothetical protein
VKSSEVNAAITAAGLYPVLLQGVADGEDAGPLIEGGLDEFLAAAKVLGAKAVFYYVSTFDERDFLVEMSAGAGVPAEIADEEEEDDESIDLRKISPGIAGFKAHLGKDCAFLLRAEGGVAKLGCYIEEDWWTAFGEKRVDALAEWSKRRGERMAEADVEQAKRGEELVESLHALLDDATFVAIRTQQGMKAYALKVISGLDELDARVLTAEIQALKGEVDARGLNRKKH